MLAWMVLDEKHTFFCGGGGTLAVEGGVEELAAPWPGQDVSCVASLAMSLTSGATPGRPQWQQ